MVGSAAGDALGAPFEFRPSGTYTDTYPTPVLGGMGEMTGGGTFGWGPGEFTDDTQMALALAESILSGGGMFIPDLAWNHFRAWVTDAADVGITTSSSLMSADWRTAAEEAHRSLGRSTSNGCVMRIAPIGIAGVVWGPDATRSVARDQASLTHFDPACGWGAAIVADLIRRLILQESFESALHDSVASVDDDRHRARYAALLSPAWHPDDTEPTGNGSVWMCIAQAVWAVRSTSSFEAAVVAAVDLGDDADTTAAVAGAIAGARYGITAIPTRWTTHLHGYVRQPDGSRRRYRLGDLTHIAHGLVGEPERPETPPEAAVAPAQVHDENVFAANLAGASESSPDMAVVSLCRGTGLFDRHVWRREVYLLDEAGGQNPNLRTAVEEAVNSIDAFLRSGRSVVVHCHGGRSRTGLVLKAWYMRRHGADHESAHQWLTEQWPLYSTWNQRFSEFLDDEWEMQ